MATIDTTASTARPRTGAADEALLRLGQALKDTGYQFTTVTPATTSASTGARRTRSPLRDVFGWSRPFRPEVVPPDLRALLWAAGAVASEGERWRSRVRFSSYDGELFCHSAFPTDAAGSVLFGPDTYRMAPGQCWANWSRVRCTTSADRAIPLSVSDCP